ncbi:hypothetical protein ACFVSQ_35720 [Streptomyces niveus]|uniref:hypothetical protein n=1 Tax=Streptomyces niveus TaxID=193462 RepID=UPI0036F0FD3B
MRLRDEDRATYTEALDDVIGSTEIQRRLARSGVKASQLRVLGLAEGPRVASTAEREYRSYLALRQRARGEAPLMPSLSGPGRQQVYGAGLLPVLAVLTPVLAITAAALFLLLGYGLRLADSAAAVAGNLVHAGWISLGIGALAAAVGVLGLYRTASRHRGGVPKDRRDQGLTAELDAARAAWLHQLHEGIRSLLLQHLDRSPPPDAGGNGPGGNGQGGVGAGNDEAAVHSPRFSSPRYTGPDFGSPEASGPDIPTLRG